MSHIKELTNGYTTFVDEQDLDLFIDRNWCALVRRGKVSAVYGTYKGVTYYLHRIIAARVGLIGQSKVLIDHVDANPLNNTRSNLRVADKFENQRNRGKNRNNISGYKGVSPAPTAGKWVAHIMTNRKRQYLGTFETKEEARDAYVEAAKTNHKDFARF